MSKSRKTSSVILTGNFKSIGGLYLVLFGIYYIAGHVPAMDFPSPEKVIIGYILLLVPLSLYSSYGAFLKLYSGQLTFGPAQESSFGTLIYIMILGLVGVLGEIFVVVGYRHYENNRTILAAIFLLLLCASIVAYIILYRRIVHKATDPENIPPELNRESAKRLFYTSALILFLGAICVGLVCLAVYLIGWRKMYVFGGVSVVSMIPVFIYLRHKTKWAVTEYKIPAEIEVVGIMLF